MKKIVTICKWALVNGLYVYVGVGMPHRFELGRRQVNRGGCTMLLIGGESGGACTSADEAFGCLLQGSRNLPFVDVNGDRLTSATVEKHLRLAREALAVETTAQAVLKAALHNQMFVMEA